MVDRFLVCVDVHVVSPAVAKAACLQAASVNRSVVSRSPRYQCARLSPPIQPLTTGDWLVLPVRGLAWAWPVAVPQRQRGVNFLLAL